MTDLYAQRIGTSLEVDTLRTIRNACRDGFSNDTHEISQQQQQAWWVVMRGQVKAWLYFNRSSQAVGYGLLRQTEDGRWWSSVAVLPEFAGNGYGGYITADLVRRHDGQVWATARLDNPAAMRLHREADWEEWQRDDRLAHYRTRPHVWMAEAYEQWAEVGWVTV